MSDKPRKKDFTDMREFMRAAAAWAEQNHPKNEWPWGGPPDEDDDYYYVEAELVVSFPNGEHDLPAENDCDSPFDFPCDPDPLRERS